MFDAFCLIQPTGIAMQNSRIFFNSICCVKNCIKVLKILNLATGIFPYIFILSVLALFLVMQTNWVQNILHKYTVCSRRQEKLITPQHLLCLWSKIIRRALLPNGFSMILSSQTRLINFAQNALGLRNFGQKNELQYLKKIPGFVKSGIQIFYEVNSLVHCFGSNFCSCNRIDWVQTHDVSQTPVAFYAARKSL